MTLKPTIANAELLRTQMQLLAEASERAYLFSIFVVAVIAYSLWPDVPTAHVLTWAVVSITIQSWDGVQDPKFFIPECGGSLAYDTPTDPVRTPPWTCLGATRVS